jgi:hypothetical protein
LPWVITVKKVERVGPNAPIEARIFT